MGFAMTPYFVKSGWKAGKATYFFIIFLESMATGTIYLYFHILAVSYFTTAT